MGGGDGRTLMQSCVSSSDEVHCVKLGSINNAKLILRSPTRNPVIQIDKKNWYVWILHLVYYKVALPKESSFVNEFHCIVKSSVGVRFKNDNSVSSDELVETVSAPCALG